VPPSLPLRWASLYRRATLASSLAGLELRCATLPSSPAGLELRQRTTFSLRRSWRRVPHRPVVAS
jgi:hypothetical protein